MVAVTPEAHPFSHVKTSQKSMETQRVSNRMHDAKQLTYLEPRDKRNAFLPHAILVPAIMQQ